jgi:pSer/pThr/pTyr-binding forkhead associated (FHA) protein
MSPEQIQPRIQNPTHAALIDVWGRAHQLDARTLVGRQVENRGIAVLEPSVSRHHAHLTYENGTWTVRDLGSANGTYHEDRLVEQPVAVKTGERIRFGHIAFYMVEDVAALPTPKASRTTTSTIKPPFPVAVPVAAPVAPGNDDDDDAFGEERTDIGLPEMRFRLHEPTGGGGGLIEVDGKQVQLTTTQFELMALMIKRMAAERHQPELVRGFVRSSELIADLSWDTREPSENHVKQLVRRVRRALMKSEIGDLIESRHRFGYRLRAIPKVD